VQQYGHALHYAAAPLRADREIVLAAVQQDGLALHYAATPLMADRDIVLAAVQHDFALKYAAAPLRADREIVLAAVQQHGGALEFTTAELRGDAQVVLAAVKSAGDEALKHASSELKVDPVLRSWSTLTRAQRRWRQLREHSLVLDPIGSYWYQQTMRAVVNAEGRAVMVGRGAKRMRSEYESGVVMQMEE
jgi:hypothetical protein